jgi:hypothetical protein
MQVRPAEMDGVEPSLAGQPLEEADIQGEHQLPINGLGHRVLAGIAGDRVEDPRRARIDGTLREIDEHIGDPVQRWAHQLGVLAQLANHT